MERITGLDLIKSLAIVVIGVGYGIVMKEVIKL